MAQTHPSARVLGALAVAALAAVGPLRAQITLAPAQVALRSGERCLFTAAHPDGTQGAWAWTVLEPDGGSLVPGDGGKAEYSAPKVQTQRVFHVQVWEDVHPPRVAIQAVQVLPAVDAAVARLRAADWMVPKLEIFAGDPEPGPEARTARFNGIRKAVFLDAPVWPGHLNRHWAVGDGFGIQLVSSRGEVRPWLGARERPANGQEPPPDLADPEAFICSGLAVRPSGSSPANPLHLVFCALSLHPAYACRVYALEPGGGRRLLAGGPGAGYQDGPAAQALFGTIGDLALDRDGNVYLLDRGNLVVRKLSVDGQVTTVAGHRPAGSPEFKDGRGVDAAFQDPTALALDPRTGDLFVSDANAIRRITPSGDVTTLLGAGAGPGQAGGFELPSDDPFAQVPAGVNCLHHPEGLALQGRNLFIADRDNCAVRVYDLDLGTLHTVAGHPFEQHTRRGPLAYYNPGRPVAECAALASPRCVSFGPGDICLVGTGECLATLDMPPFQAPARIVRQGLPEETAEPRPRPVETTAPVQGNQVSAPPQGLFPAPVQTTVRVQQPSPPADQAVAPIPVVIRMAEAAEAPAPH